MEDIILAGYSGHAASVADCIERTGKYRIVGYTDIERRSCKYQYLGNDEVLPEYYQQGVQNAAVTVGYLGKGTIREKLYDRLIRIGYELTVIADPSAIISASAVVEAGTFIGKGAIVNANSKIGRMCIINTKALVEHDCCISDYAHIAVGAVLCGQVFVGEAAFIGANATVIQCMQIRERSIVPAGEVTRRK